MFGAARARSVSNLAHPGLVWLRIIALICESTRMPHILCFGVYMFDGSYWNEGRKRCGRLGAEWSANGALKKNICSSADVAGVRSRAQAHLQRIVGLPLEREAGRSSRRSCLHSITPPWTLPLHTSFYKVFFSFLALQYYPLTIQWATYSLR